MRTNLPVTQREYSFDARSTLLSVTDPKGRITYANSAFVAVSGFDRDELMGQPHNLVRHPDMPVEAFADMWATIKSGRSWTALVKNRRKDGDHYWVRANASPMVRNGQIVGYLSVRTAPSREEVQAAEQLYRQFREGKARGLAFHQGLVVKTGLRAWLSALQRCSTAVRLRVALWGAMLVPAGVGVWQALSSVNPLLGAGVVAGAVVGAALADGFLSAQVLRPLRTMRQQALLVASGAATEAPPLNRVDDIGVIARSINQAGLNLRALVDDVALQVGDVSAAAEEIDSGNRELSSRTESNAASLEETAASMEELSATVSQNAENARQASQQVQVARESARSGGEVVRGVVKTMDRITQSSERMVQIVSTIDGIAFQTNILALNAAVEAARAGEAGRGFAVVAGEVRTLAQRSAEASKEIRDLIQSGISEARAGAGLVEQAGQSVDAIIGRVEEVAALVSDIALASVEQSSGIGQIGEALGSLDENTQSNAAMVEELAAAASALRRQSRLLDEAVTVWSNERH